MDISVILLIIGVLLGIYLIFKLIKKVVFIIIALVVFFLVVVGAVFGIVYLDFKNLTSQTDFDIQVIYVDGENYEFGFEIPVRDKNVSLDGIKKIEDSSLDSLDVDSVEKEDKVYVVLIDSKFYEQRVEDESYSLENLDVMEDIGNFSLEISGDEVIEIIKSNNSEEVLVDMLLEENNIPFADKVKPVFEESLEEGLDEVDLGVEELVFALTLSEMIEDEKQLLYLAEGFKSGEIEIYPDRIAFSLVRMLPLDKIVNNVPTKEVVIEE